MSIKSNVNLAKFIGAYCIVGAPPENINGFPESGMGVILDKDCVLNGLVTVDSGKEVPTYIGKRVFLMKGVHVGHDCVISNDVVVAPHVSFGGHCFIGVNSNFGMGAVIHNRCEIPPYCMVGMGAVMTKGACEKMKPFEIWAGNPAVYIKQNTILQERLKISDEDVKHIIHDYLHSRAAR
jgi:UDP-N-acetylglucosamine acyltransferase